MVIYLSFGPFVCYWQEGIACNCHSLILWVFSDLLLVQKYKLTTCAIKARVFWGVFLLVSSYSDNISVKPTVFLTVSKCFFPG